MQQWWQQTSLRRQFAVGLIALGVWTLLVAVAFVAIPGGLAVLAVLLGLAGWVLLAGWLVMLRVLMRDRRILPSHKGVL